MKTKTLPIAEVIARYQRAQPDGHWFDRDTMSFFKTKLPRLAHCDDVGNAYFITRETDPHGGSRYTIRFQSVKNKIITTIGEFHSYKIRSEAFATMKSIIALENIKVHI